MEFTGGCYCGQVRYEAKGEPLMRGQCHCRECQYISGGSANVIIAMPRSGFHYTSGEPETFQRSDLENGVVREFCGNCGTSLTSNPPGMAEMVIIKVGTMDDPTEFGEPEMAIYCVDKQKFHYLPEGMITFDRFPASTKDVQYLLLSIGPDFELLLCEYINQKKVKKMKVASAVHISAIALLLAVASTPSSGAQHDQRPRARDIGIVVGEFSPGKHNAITDVDGVRVGHTTVIEGDDIRTGVTAIIPAPGNLYTDPVPAWIHVGNGYGKLIGSTQLLEFGELETPILLTCTLCVWRAAEALKDWTYRQPGMGEHTINPVVGEVNDSVVNNMWAAPLKSEHVYAALDGAASGPVDEGSVGGGTGAQTYHWKGGIGTSSRVLPKQLGGYTVGVLVQSNLLAGATLRMNGAPVGRALDQYAYKNAYAQSSQGAYSKQDGSIMMVVATDAPLDTRTLARLAMRSMLGLARTGSVAENGSGDYVIAFSTNPAVRRKRNSDTPLTTPSLLNSSMDPLFTAAVDATEEAVYNALLRATTVESARGRLSAIPVEQLLPVLKEYRVIE